MWNEIVTLFTEMGTLPAIFLSIGIVLGIIEIILPGFGVFGVMGAIMTVLGIAFRIAVGATIAQIIIMVCIVIAIGLVLALILTHSAKRGILSKTGLVASGASVPSDYASDKKNYAHLLGREGLTQTVCKPVGKMDIESLSYQVLSNGEYIKKGVRVKVIEVDGLNIIVKKI